MTYTFKLRGKTYTATTLAGISAIYCLLRDESGEGGSTFPSPSIKQNGKITCRFSYNGRIWPLADWTADLQPIYDNRKAA